MNTPDEPDKLAADQLQELLGNVPYSAIAGPDIHTFGLDWSSDDVERWGRDPATCFPFPDIFTFGYIHNNTSPFPRTIAFPSFVPRTDSWDDIASDEGTTEDGTTESELARLLEMLWRRLTTSDGAPLATIRRVLTALVGRGEAFLRPVDRVYTTKSHNTRNIRVIKHGTIELLQSSLSFIWNQITRGESSDTICNTYDLLSDNFTLPSALIACQKSLLIHELIERDTVLNEALFLSRKYTILQIRRLSTNEDWSIKFPAKRLTISQDRRGKWPPLAPFIHAAITSSAHRGQVVEANTLWEFISKNPAALLHCSNHQISLDSMLALSPQSWSGVRKYGKEFRG